MNSPIRVWLWRHLHWALPALPGWEERLHQFVLSDGNYVDPVARTQGSPPAWLLMTRTEGRLVFETATCAWTGAPVSGETRIVTLPDGSQAVGGKTLGYKCARCGVPLHYKAAGMRDQADIPSCPPCRRRIQRAVEQS